MNAASDRRSGFVDWPLIVAVVLVITIVTGGAVAWVAYEKRMSESRSGVKTPPPPAIRASYYGPLEDQTGTAE